MVKMFYEYYFHCYAHQWKYLNGIFSKLQYLITKAYSLLSTRNQLLNIYWNVIHQGSNGTEGPQGPKGELGAQGTTGEKGEKGEIGEGRRGQKVSSPAIDN